MLWIYFSLYSDQIQLRTKLDAAAATHDVGEKIYLLYILCININANIHTKRAEFA